MSTKFGKKILTILTPVIISGLMSGCSHENSEPPEQKYTVISDGTQATEETEPVTEDIYRNVSSHKLYIPENMETRYASLSYDKDMQQVYDDVLVAMLKLKEKDSIHVEIPIEQFQNVLETVRCEQLMLFYLQSREGDYNYSARTADMTFSYKYGIKEINIMLMETEAAAREIIALTDESMSDYEKLKIFHDYLVLNVESDEEDPYSDSVYGALVQKKALCEGYAKAFSYLCNIAGIENIIVTGYTDVYHMWNMVRLGDSWYHVDVGWDKPVEALSARYPDMVLYQYFLAGDSVMENNRIISNMLFDPPSADSTDMNYFTMEDRYASAYDKALEIIERSCRRCIDSGEKYFMIKLDSSNLYLQTTADLIKQGADGASDIDRLMDKLNFNGQISYIDFYKSYRIIIFVME